MAGLLIPSLTAAAAPPCDTIVYRFFQPSAVDHIFIAAAQPPKLGTPWQLEQLAFFACTAPAEGLIEIHRYYSTSRKDHLYLPAGDDAPPGYAAEGVAFYIPAQEEPCLLPLFLARRGTGDDTILAVRPDDVAELTRSPWSVVKLVGWVRPYTDVETKMAADRCRK